ncbi:hypothetical protein EMIT079MI2_220011 [Bacillus sp. IT-79MI2]
MNCKRITGIRGTGEIFKIMGAKIFLLKYNKKESFHKDSATGNNKYIEVR